MFFSIMDKSYDGLVQRECHSLLKISIETPQTVAFFGATTNNITAFAVGEYSKTGLMYEVYVCGIAQIAKVGTFWDWHNWF